MATQEINKGSCSHWVSHIGIETYLLLYLMTGWSYTLCMSKLQPDLQEGLGTKVCVCVVVIFCDPHFTGHIECKMSPISTEYNHIRWPSW